MSTQADIDLRKKEKKIDRKHWMCRIQKYTFDIDAPTYYMGYCPFFWMTWVALICFLPVFLVRISSAPFSWVWDKCTTPVVTYKKVSREKIQNTPLQPSPYELVEIAEAYGVDDMETTSWLYRFIDSPSTIPRIVLWMKANPNWRETHLPQAKKFVEEEEAAIREDLARIAARHARVRKINRLASSCGSLLFKILIPILILGLGLAAGIGIVQLLKIPSLQDYLFALLVGCGAYSLVLFGKLLFSALTIYFDNRDLKSPDKPFWIIEAIRTVCFWTADKFLTVWEFIHETISMTYKQECPLIVWGEETGKIEKRVK